MVRIGTRMTRILRIYADFLGCFIFRFHFGIHWDTNGSTDFTDFTDSYGFFSCPSVGNSDSYGRTRKNPYPSVKFVKSVHPFVSQCIPKCNLKMKHPKQSAKSAGKKSFLPIECTFLKILQRTASKFKQLLHRNFTIHFFEIIFILQRRISG
ncbi:MAG: hypothetical protein RLZZ628_2069 [Bacteroidota bacterium]|jgi:hypothetical protein